MNPRALRADLVALGNNLPARRGPPRELAFGPQTTRSGRIPGEPEELALARCSRCGYFGGLEESGARGGVFGFGGTGGGVSSLGVLSV